MLGAEKTYERRNGSACCYINPDFERAIKNVSCHCSREDYEWCQSLHTRILYIGHSLLLCRIVCVGVD